MVSREVSALSRLDFVIDRFWLGILRLEDTIGMKPFVKSNHVFYIIFTTICRKLKLFLKSQGITKSNESPLKIILPHCGVGTMWHCQDRLCLKQPRLSSISIVHIISQHCAQQASFFLEPRHLHLFLSCVRTTL